MGPGVRSSGSIILLRMETAEIQHLLKEGIAAIRQGDRARGRELLLKVVEADERSEPAWLWLSAAVDDPNDKLTALENALTLNPHNAPAQAQLRELRKQMGIAQPQAPPGSEPPPRPQPAPAASPPPLAVAPPDPDEDPYQCAYCGKLTQETDTTCPHCGRSLLTMGEWEGRRTFQNSLLLLTGLNLQLAIFQTLGPITAIGIAQGMVEPWMIRMFERFAFITIFFGDFLTWAKAGTTTGPFAGAFARDLLWVVLFLMLYTDMDSVYAVALGVVLADMLWAMIGAAVGYLGLAAAIINFAAGGLIALVAALAILSRRRARVRLVVRLDKDAHGALGMYHFGQTYRRRGQWALAALHFQKAIALKPSEARFYKDAGVALAQLGRPAQALRVLEEGARRAPEDADFMKLIKVIKT